MKHAIRSLGLAGGSMSGVCRKKIAYTRRSARSAVALGVAAALAVPPCALAAAMPDPGQLGTVIQTIDFAFEPAVGIGNRVWIEKNGRPGFQGSQDDHVRAGTIPADEPAASVTVELVKPADPSTGAPATPVGQDTTDTEGCYLIDRMADARVIPDGSYYVRIPQKNFNSGGPLFGYNAANSYSDAPVVDDGGVWNIVEEQTGSGFYAGDQNGRSGGDLGAVISQAYSLTHGQEPSNEPGTRCSTKVSTLPDNSVNLTADFAFDRKVALRNLVWIEKNGIDGFQRLNPNPGAPFTADVPIAGVQVVLRNANDQGFSLMTTTAEGGFYLFDQLTPGTYYVEVPKTEFASGRPLAGYVPTPQPGVEDAVDDGNGDSVTGDHSAQVMAPGGVPEDSGVRTNNFDLQPGLAPTGETGRKSTDQPSKPSAPTLTSALPDNDVNLTAALAFVESNPPPTALASLGSTLWIDVNWNGVQDRYWGKDPVTKALTPYPEPVIKGCQVRVWGPTDGTPAENLTNTDMNGTYHVGSLLPGTYEVSVPKGRSGIDCVTAQIKAFYSSAQAKLTGLSAGLPATLALLPATTVHKTWEGADKTDEEIATDDMVDGDNDGIQAVPGETVQAPTITLVLGSEPQNSYTAVKGTSGVELTFANDTTGRTLDDADLETETSGNMTVDFGFVHQCADICDINRDGKVTNYRYRHASGSFNTGNCYRPNSVNGYSVAELIEAGVSDTDIIRCLNLTNPTWASTVGKVLPDGLPTKGMPGSGDCDADGSDSANDARYCEVFVQPSVL